jgi:hypothetical protein
MFLAPLIASFVLLASTAIPLETPTVIVAFLAFPGNINLQTELPSAKTVRQGGSQVTQLHQLVVCVPLDSFLMLVALPYAISAQLVCSPIVLDPAFVFLVILESTLIL